MALFLVSSVFGMQISNTPVLTGCGNTIVAHESAVSRVGTGPIHWLVRMSRSTQLPQYHGDVPISRKYCIVVSWAFVKHFGQ